MGGGPRPRIPGWLGRVQARVDPPRFERSYPLNVANVVLALFPGLINTSAIAILAPTIGHDLGVTPDRVGVLPLLNDAALAFGCLLAAELARRIAGRTLFYWLMSFSLVTSLVSALAPTFAVLLIAHIFHGLFGGMLFVVMLPPLLTTFGSHKVRSTATVLVPSLFGAATLGPVLGAAVAQPQVWRSIFAGEVVMSIAALVLGGLTLAKREPTPTTEPVDVVALALAALGSAGIFLGVGSFAQHDWTYPPALLPLAAGIAAFGALFVFEAATSHPLVPVRRMLTSIAVVGAISSVVGSAAFAATQQSLILALARIDGLGTRATGFAFWPEFIAAFVAGITFGRLVGTRWLVLIGTLGLVVTAAAAGIARVVMPVTATSAPWIVVLVGLGAGFAVTPGLFVVALSFERALVARAIALLNLLRLSGGFISGPGVEHTIGDRTATRLGDIVPRELVSRTAVRDFIVTGNHDGLPLGALQHALAGALNDALMIVVVLAALAAASNAIVLIAAHVPLRRPQLQAIDDGRPALTAPA